MLNMCIIDMYHNRQESLLKTEVLCPAQSHLSPVTCQNLLRVFSLQRCSNAYILNL